LSILRGGNYRRLNSRPYSSWFWSGMGVIKQDKPEIEWAGFIF
jgi:hypothetical protein